MHIDSRRFDYQGNKCRQISTHVDFPLQDLDVSSYAANHQVSQTGDKYTFDLCDVINYNGSMTKGHYTAYCLNAINKKWYELDDAV